MADKRTLNPTQHPTRFDVDAQGLRAEWAFLRHIYGNNEVNKPIAWQDSDRIDHDTLQYAYNLLVDYANAEYRHLFDSDRIADGRHWFGVNSNKDIPFTWDENDGSNYDFEVNAENITYLRQLMSQYGDFNQPVDLPGTGALDKKIPRTPSGMIAVDSDSTTRLVPYPLVMKSHFDRFLSTDPIERAKILARVWQALTEDSDRIHQLQRYLADTFKNSLSTDTSTRIQTFRYFIDRFLYHFEFDSDNRELDGGFYSSGYGYPRGESDPDYLEAYDIRQRLTQVIAHGVYFDSDTHDTRDTALNLASRWFQSALARRLKYDIRTDQYAESSHSYWFDNAWYDYFKNNYAYTGNNVDSDLTLGGPLNDSIIDTRRQNFVEFLTSLLGYPTYTNNNLEDEVNNRNNNNVSRNYYYDLNQTFVENLLSTYIDRDSDQAGWFARRVTDAISHEESNILDEDSDRENFVTRIFWDYFHYDSDKFFSNDSEGYDSNNAIPEVRARRLIQEVIQPQLRRNEADRESWFRDTLIRLLDSEYTINHWTNRNDLVKFNLLNWLDRVHDSEHNAHRDELMRLTLRNWLDSEYDPDSYQHQRELWRRIGQEYLHQDSDDMNHLWKDLLDRIDPENDSEGFMNEYASHEFLLYDRPTAERFNRILASSLSADSDAAIGLTSTILTTLTYDSDTRNFFNTSIRRASTTTNEQRISNIRNITIAMSDDDTGPHFDSDGIAWNIVDSDGMGNYPIYSDYKPWQRDSEEQYWYQHTQGLGQQFTDDQEASRVFIHDIVRTIGDQPNVNTFDVRNSLNDLTRHIVNRIDRDIVVARQLSHELHDHSRTFVQRLTVGDDSELAAYAVTAGDTTVTFTVPNSWRKPEPHRVRTYLNGVLQTSNQDTLANGSVTFDTSNRQDVPDVTVSTSELTRDITIEFEIPLRDNYVVTIEYVSTIEDYESGVR